MKILAFDCAGTGVACAVTEDERLIAESSLQSEVKHSVTLLPMIEAALEGAGIGVRDIDLFAVTAGPGSFTGVRIGISLLKGLAFGTGKPCCAVSTLEALAYGLRGFEGIICPVMDARRGQLYNALFENGERLCGDRLIAAGELAAELESLGRPVYFTGDGAATARAGATVAQLCETPERLMYMSGYAVAQCGLANSKKGVGIYTDAGIKPIYLRASQAERERNERLKRDGK